MRIQQDLKTNAQKNRKLINPKQYLHNKSKITNLTNSIYSRKEYILYVKCLK